MPYFLQHFAKNWVKTLVHGTLHKKVLTSRRSTSFRGFSQNAILLQYFAKNWVKTLVHGTLQKKVLTSRRSTNFGGMAFGEKPPKVVDLLEISNFLCKVPCTRALTQFLAKCCKKYGIW